MALAMSLAIQSIFLSLADEIINLFLFIFEKDQSTGAGWLQQWRLLTEY